MEKIKVSYVGGNIGEPQKGQVFGGTAATNYVIKKAFEDSQDFELNIKTRKDFEHIAEVKSFLDEGEISWCFIRNTPVETRLGTKNIQDIKVGDYVKTHKNRFKKVIKLYKTPYKRRNKLIEIKTNNSITKCTPEHPFMLLYNGNDYNWEEAQCLTKRDKLLYPIDYNEDIFSFNHSKLRTHNKTTSAIKDIIVDEKFARFMGLYLAEGCTSERAIRFTFGNHEEKLINEVKDFCLNTFGRNMTEDKRWATTINLNISSLVPFFHSKFGTKANNKKIPREVFKWNTKNKISFLLGYLDGDGHIYEGGDATCTTSSERLSRDLIKLCNSIGVSPTLVVREPRECVGKKIKINSNKSYQLEFRRTEFRKILDINESDNYVLIGDINYAIIDVKEVNIKEMNNSKVYGNYVYNLEVEEDNSYIVNSSAVHNCDDVSLLELYYLAGYPRPDLIGPITRSPVKRYNGGEWESKYTPQYFYGGKVIRLNESEEKNSSLLPQYKGIDFVSRINFIRHGVDLDTLETKNKERKYILWGGQKNRYAKNYAFWEDVREIIVSMGGLPKPYEFKTMSGYIVDDYWDTLDETALVVNTSLYESFCSAVAEARAKGCGVLVREKFNGDCVHLNQPGQTPYTPKDYAERILFLCNNPEEMRKLQEDSFKYVVDNCSLETMREDIEKILMGIHNGK